MKKTFAIISSLFLLFIFSTSADDQAKRGVVADSWNTDYTNADASLFTGDFSYSIPLLSFPGKGGLSFDITLTYNSDVNETLYAENKNKQTSKIGLGWEMPIPSISVMNRNPFLSNDTPFPQADQLFPMYTLNLPSGTHILTNLNDRNFFDGSNPLCLPTGTFDRCHLFYAIDNPLIRAKLFIDDADGNTQFEVQGPSGTQYIFAHKRNIPAIKNLRWDASDNNEDYSNFGYPACTLEGLGPCQETYNAFNLFTSNDVILYPYQYDITEIRDASSTNRIHFNWKDIPAPYDYYVLKQFQKRTRCIDPGPGQFGYCQPNDRWDYTDPPCTVIDSVSGGGTYNADSLLDSVAITTGSSFWDGQNQRLSSGGIVGYVYKFIYDTRADFQIEQPSSEIAKEKYHCEEVFVDLDNDATVCGRTGWCQAGFPYFRMNQPGIYSEKRLSEVRLLYFGPGDNLEGSADILENALFTQTIVNKGGTVNTTKLKLDSVQLRGLSNTTQPAFTFTYNTNGILQDILSPLGGTVHINYEPRAYAYTGGNTGIEITNLTAGDVIDETTIIEVPEHHEYYYYDILHWIDFRTKKNAQDMTTITGLQVFSYTPLHGAQDYLSAVVGDAFNIFLLNVTDIKNPKIIENLNFGNWPELQGIKRGGVAVNYPWVFAGTHKEGLQNGWVKTYHIKDNWIAVNNVMEYHFNDLPGNFFAEWSSIDIGFKPRMMQREGNTLYVVGYEQSTGKGKLAKINIANPMNLVLMGEWYVSNTGEDAHSITITQRYFYIATGNGIKMYDKNIPATVFRTIEAGKAFSRVEIHDVNHLYAQASGKIMIFELVEDEPDPIVFLMYSTPTPIEGFITYDGHVFLKNLGQPDTHQVVDVFSNGGYLIENNIFISKSNGVTGCQYSSGTVSAQPPLDNHYDFNCVFTYATGTQRIRQNSQTGPIIEQCSWDELTLPHTESKQVQLNPGTYFIEICNSQVDGENHGSGYAELKNRYHGPGPYYKDEVTDLQLDAKLQASYGKNILFAQGTLLSGFTFKEDSSGTKGWRVDDITTGDGLSQQITKTYAYEGGNYIPPYEGYFYEKCMDAYYNHDGTKPIECRTKHSYPDNVGYSKVTVSQEGYGRTEYYFYNELNNELCPTCPVINGGNVEAYYARGQPYKIKVINQSGNLMSEETTTLEQHTFREKYSGSISTYSAAKSTYPIQKTSMQDGTTTTTTYLYDWTTLNRPLARETRVTGSHDEIKRAYNTYAYEISGNLFFAYNLLGLVSYTQTGHTGIGAQNTAFNINPLQTTNLDGFSATGYQTTLSPSFGKPLWTGNWIDTDSDKQLDGASVETSPELIKTQFAYETNGRVSQVTNPKGETSYIYYEGPTDPCDDTPGSDTQYGRYFPTCFKNPLLQKEKNLYNIRGQANQYINSNDQTSKFDYDNLWRPIKTFQPGDTYPTLPSEEYTYTFARNLGSTLLYTGDNPTAWRLNSVLTKTRSKNSNDDSLKMRTTAFADGMGRVVSTTSIDTDNDPARPLRIKNTFNSIGLTETTTELYKTQVETSPDFTKLYYENSPQKRVVKTNPLGMPSAVVTTDYTSNATHTINTVNNELGQKARSASEKIGITGELISSFGQDNLLTTTKMNDIRGLSTDTLNPSGQVTYSRSDTLGRLRVAQHPDYNVRRNLKYDNNGNLLVSGEDCCPKAGCTGTTIDNFMGNPSTYQCSRYNAFSYDSLNRNTCAKYGISGTDANSWAGTSCTGAHVLNYYDTPATAIGCDNLGSACNDEYSCTKGQLTGVSNTYSGDFKACYYYNKRGQLTKEKRKIDNGNWYEINYAYDNAGNMLSMTYPNNKVVSYEYNILNQLLNVKVDNSLLSSYSYYPDGLIQTKTYDNKCE
ncbi:MAG: hypothetical protein ABIJ21_07095 [Nanoarchaeota archaeon]